MASLSTSLLAYLLTFPRSRVFFFFFFNDTATTEIYTLSLHDALPISDVSLARIAASSISGRSDTRRRIGSENSLRSEEHTSELQSLAYLVCRLLLEKKKKIRNDRLLARRSQEI